jgi:hypothetical protein
VYRRLTVPLSLSKAGEPVAVTSDSTSFQNGLVNGRQPNLGVPEKLSREGPSPTELARVLERNTRIIKKKLRSTSILPIRKVRGRQSSLRLLENHESAVAHIEPRRRTEVPPLGRATPRS